MIRKLPAAADVAVATRTEGLQAQICNQHWVVFSVERRRSRFAGAPAIR
jgi:hypothetical protein